MAHGPAHGTQGCYAYNFEHEMRYEFKSSKRFFRLFAKKKVGCNLEFFACHVTKALCVIYETVGNLILNKKVLVN